MKRVTEQPPALLHNIGGPPRASILWRGFGRGPLADETERIVVARTRGTWVSFSLSIGQHDARYARDWNSAAALLRLFEPGHALDEEAATRNVTHRIEAHAARLAWPPTLLVGQRGAERGQTITLDDALTTFVALAKSTGSLWLRQRPVRLAPLQVPTQVDPGGAPSRNVRWGQALWFPDGVPETLLSQAMAQARARMQPTPKSQPSSTQP